MLYHFDQKVLHLPPILMNVYSTRKILKLFFVQDMFGTHYTDLLKWFGINLFYYQRHRSSYEVSVFTVWSLLKMMLPKESTTVPLPPSSHPVSILCHFCSLPYYSHFLTLFSKQNFPWLKIGQCRQHFQSFRTHKKVNIDSFFNIS